MSLGEAAPNVFNAAAKPGVVKCAAERMIKFKWTHHTQNVIIIIIISKLKYFKEKCNFSYM